ICPMDTTVPCNQSTDPLATGTATATDACSGVTVTHSDTVMLSNCPDSFTIRRHWVATDGCGNSSSCEQTINVRDTVAPTLHNVPADQRVACDSVPAPASNVMATDNCDPSPTVAFSETRTDGSCADNYTLNRRWTATD